MRRQRAGAAARCSSGCGRPDWARRRGPPPRSSTTGCASGSRPTSCRWPAGSRSSRPRHAERAALDGDGDVRPHRGALGAGRAHAGRSASCRSAPAGSPSSCRCRSSPFTPCSGGRTGSRRSPREENLKHTAVFRLALGRTDPQPQASWVKMGLDAATEALHWGVNDLGGTLMEESIRGWPAATTACGSNPRTSSRPPIAPAARPRSAQHSTRLGVAMSFR